MMELVGGNFESWWAVFQGKTWEQDAFLPQKNDVSPFVATWRCCVQSCAAAENVFPLICQEQNTWLNWKGIKK